MTSLSDALLAPGTRTNVVTDMVGVIDDEVRGKGGLSGAAIKSAYAAVRKVSPTIVEKATNVMLPDFAKALDPFWTDFNQTADAQHADFGSYLADRPTEASEAILAVTDARAESTSKAPLRRAYKSVRGKAREHVTAALPRVGTTLQKHAG